MDTVQLREAVTQFLALEAMLLDEGRFDDWYAMLDDAIVYEAPLRLATIKRGDEMVAGAYRFADDKKIIRTRIDRIKTGNAYAESPPSRTVRSVSSVAILGENGGVVTVSSTLIVYRQRANDPSGDTIHARRNDRLRFTPDGLRLCARTVILAEVSLSTPNLGIFL
jgi:3-phenylpropionate/cinnamic acid dioxygenase small subunit